ncbi:uncharacterized protein LOC131853865 [Achroia grisella]|uniref:uncharacterized protein LOC131853865 n=1 Tax=Achroia grisella TaxID=688607 RepID=UPI0027D32030|nr:uncharacterized protein LOC131853865 [Achroia grisella]
MSAPPPPPPPLQPHLPAPPRHVETVHIVETNTASVAVTILNIINAITHWMLGGVAISAFMYANNLKIFSPISTISTHIYLCVSGYVLLMSLAVTSMSPYSGFSRTFNQKQKKTIHFVLQVLGSILALAGSILRITSLNENFNSTHGILGWVAMILTFLSLIGGVINLYSQKLNLFPFLIRSCHACIGCVTLIVAFLCLIFGFTQVRFMGEINANMSIGLTVCALLGVLLSPCVTFVKRLLARK